jgi:uncharacterized protein YndB with AHSA1/START domain
MSAVQDQIVRDVEINAPIEKVWAAITQPEHLGTWFADTSATVDFRVGGDISLTWAEYPNQVARIEAIEEPNRFAWWWSNIDGSFASGNATLVEFLLESSGTITKLRVVESGFSKLDMTPEKQAERHAENTGGWQSEIDELKTYVEKLAA